MTSGDAAVTETGAEELAVVVGATGAFGRAIVTRLQSRGLTVLAVGRQVAALQALRHELPGLRICVADLADDAAVVEIARHIDRPVRIVVHSPGLPVAGGVMVVPPASLVDAVNIKVGGLLRLVRAAEPMMPARARIVGIGGHYGFEPTAYAAVAGVANAALANLVRQLSLAYGGRGITAHLLAPGPADSERLRAVVAERARLQQCSVDDVLEELKAESSLQAFTTPEQVAWMVATLCDAEADALTGSSLMLDAGRRRGLP